MPKKPIPKRDIDGAFAEFEKQHPSVAEALRVFDISMKVYGTAVTALSRTATVESHNTEGVGAYLDGHQT